ncbi:Holliday junction branch migration protein RuvA [Candidatus Pantoea edessiphila]|uniref:Holliday junction branch migration complex subunit RuvA n=1 Tax=Candidatus Pantoea edessiphila TaxID=2044610 RepID=A0A2P5T2R4_9GAMM|nr:Holliday junction branch migration protein RuvA [Candidatus Pantoea edessiphila]PPI88856.1 Holliday junction branch migration protein RuvA [Candidatus Pantoea edessiphila]
MISQLKGNILEKYPPIILLEVYDVGYEINMPMTCFYKLPDINSKVIIFTHFIIRKDIQLLFGFNSKQERTLFRELIKVNGVGPKLALSILSSMSAQQFITAIENEEIISLKKLPSVGEKTAKRLVIEMKDVFKKMYKDLFEGDSAFNVNKLNKLQNITDAESEAIAALISLGYKSKDAKNMITKLGKSNEKNCEILIRTALRNII